MTEPIKQIVQTIVVNPAKQEVLLGLHKSGDFAGCYTGFLGYPEEGEELEAAARRIAREQCGISLGELELRALLRMSIAELGDADEYEFYCQEFRDKPRETELIKPTWFAIGDIPYAQMPGDDEIWYPLFLRGLRIRGQFNFAADMKVLLSHSIEEVDSLSPS